MRKRYDNHHCHNKPPDRKWDWSVDNVMTGRDGPENLRNLKKESLKFGPWWLTVEFLLLRHRVESSTVAAPVRFFRSRPAEMNWDLKHHKMRRALGWGQHSMVSISFYELCLSPRVAMNRSQEINKPFVSETTESAYICIVYLNMYL